MPAISRRCALRAGPSPAGPGRRPNQGARSSGSVSAPLAASASSASRPAAMRVSSSAISPDRAPAPCRPCRCSPWRVARHDVTRRKGGGRRPPAPRDPRGRRAALCQRAAGQNRKQARAAQRSSRWHAAPRGMAELRIEMATNTSARPSPAFERGHDMAPSPLSLPNVYSVQVPRPASPRAVSWASAIPPPCPARRRPGRRMRSRQRIRRSPSTAAACRR